MAKVLIIGASGETGSRAAMQLIAKGDSVIGLSRGLTQSTALSALGVIPVSGDLVTSSIEQFAEIMTGCDAVIFAAGASGGGMEMTDLVDGQGVVKSAKAAALAGVDQFLLVSAFPDAWRERRMPDDFEHYMFVKRQADVFLVGTTLNWVIVRPGTLLNDVGTGLVRMGLAIPYGDVSRDDVAAVLVELIHRPTVSRVILELTNGRQTIHEALANLP